MSNNFEWDQWNSRKSYLKHGITNTEAESAFNDVNRIVLFDVKHSNEEDRYICIGKSEMERILFCVFTLRNGKFRIISSRIANAKDKEQYEK